MKIIFYLYNGRHERYNVWAYAQLVRAGICETSEDPNAHKPTREHSRFGCAEVNGKAEQKTTMSKQKIRWMRSPLLCIQRVSQDASMHHSAINNKRHLSAPDNIPMIQAFGLIPATYVVNEFYVRKFVAQCHGTDSICPEVLSVREGRQHEKKTRKTDHLVALTNITTKGQQLESDTTGWQLRNLITFTTRKEQPPPVSFNNIGIPSTSYVN